MYQQLIDYGFIKKKSNLFIAEQNIFRFHFRTINAVSFSQNYNEVTFSP